MPASTIYYIQNNACRPTPTKFINHYRALHTLYILHGTHTYYIFIINDHCNIFFVGTRLTTRARLQCAKKKATHYCARAHTCVLAAVSIKKACIVSLIYVVVWQTIFDASSSMIRQAAGTHISTSVATSHAARIRLCRRRRAASNRTKCKNKQKIAATTSCMYILYIYVCKM